MKRQRRDDPWSRFSVSDEVLGIGRLLLPETRRRRIVELALVDVPPRQLSAAERVAEAAVAGFDLEGYGEIANRLTNARLAVRRLQVQR